MDNLFEQISNIQKSAAYDILSKQQTKLLDENKKLRTEVVMKDAEIKRLKDLINEYHEKMTKNLNGIY